MIFDSFSASLNWNYFNFYTLNPEESREVHQQNHTPMDQVSFSREAMRQKAMTKNLTNILGN